MGLHDIETMNEIRRELDKIDPTILVYGEGWTAGTSPLPDEQKALKANVGLLQGIAAFSDDIRDGIKGSVFEEAEPGFANGALGKEESVKFGIVGATQHPQVDYSKVNYSKEAWATDPAQSINYVAAHDNHTLWDKLKKTNPKENDEERIKMHKLSNAIVFTSQGIPFLHAGEEILRTKFGDENSYKSPDAINRIDWSKKSRYKDVYEYYKGLIALRKAHPAFRMTTAEDIQKNLSFMDMPVDNMVGYTLNNHANGDSLQTMIILFNANAEDYEVMLPKENWGVLVNGEKAGIEILEHVLEDRIIVPARSALVLGDGESLGLTVEARMSKVDSTTEPSKNRFKIIGWLGIAVVAFGGGFYWISRKKNRK